MNFIDKIKNVFGTNKISEGEGGKIIPTGYEAYGLGTYFEGSAKTKEYLEELKGWVGAATTAIADDVASIQLHLYKKEGEDIEEVTEHPVLDLLFKVNSFTSKFDHFWLTQTYLELTGEAPWFIDRVGKEIKNIFLLRPDKIKPIAGKSRMIEGYEYEIGLGETVKLDNDEVIFLKNPNPAKPFRGIGTLEMAAKIVDIDNYSEEWNSQFYKNSARPDAVLTVDTDKLSDEQKVKLKKSLRESYEGIKNAHKVMVLFGNMKFDKAGFSAKDMDFLEQQRFSRDKILGIFRVPKAIVAQTEGVNLASAKTAQYIFAKWTIKPKMERLIQQLNEFLLPLFADTENMFLDYDNPVPQDDELKLKKYESGLRNNYLTINEVRNEEGLPEVEGGDVIYVSGNIRPLGQEETPEEEKPGEEEKPKEEGKILKVKKGQTHKSKFSSDRLHELQARGKTFFARKKQIEDIKDKVRNSLKKELKKNTKINNEHKHKLITKEINNDGDIHREFSGDEIFNFWVMKNQLFEKYQEKVKAEMVEVFIAQRKIVIGKLNTKKDVGFKASSDLYNQIKLNVKDETVRTLEMTMPTLAALFKESGDESLSSINANIDMNMEREKVKDLLITKGRLFAVNVTDSTNDFIKNQVSEGLTNGESISDIKERIKGVFTSATEFRAERIARSESLKYSTRATEQAFKDSGMVKGKMWVTDPDPCPFCTELAGRTAPLDGNFVQKGGKVLDNVYDYEDIPTPPLHPNCKCDIVPVFKSKKVDMANIKKDMDSLYAKAGQGKKEIDAIGNSFVKKVTNGRLADAPIKGTERALEKVLGTYKGDVRKLTDVIRNTVVVRSEKDLVKLATTVLKDHKDILVGYKRVVSDIDDFGYSGINIKLRTPSGMIGEMQINTAWMIYAKEKEKDAIAILGKDLFNKIKKKVKVDAGKGHAFYEIGRSTNDKGLLVDVQKESIKYYDGIRKEVGTKI